MAVPVVTKPSTQTAVHGTLITPFQVVASESPTEYKASGLPTGLTIVAGTGLIEGTPTKVEKAKPKLSAKNAEGTSPEVEFEWNVTESEGEAAERRSLNPATVTLVAKTESTVTLDAEHDTITVIAHADNTKDVWFTIDGSAPVVGFGYFVAPVGNIRETIRRTVTSRSATVVRLITEGAGTVTVVGQ